MRLDDIAQDVRFGIRMLVKNPGPALIAVISLALATGATTAIFGVVRSVLLRPMPFGDPSRVVEIAGTLIQRDDLEELRARSHAFESFAEYAPGTRNLHTEAGVERLTAVVSDRDLFRVLAASPLLGRGFVKDDDLAVVVSERLWRAHLGGRPDAIGRTLTLDDRTFTVFGVMPDAFQFPYGAASILGSASTESRVDVWIAEYRPLRSRLSRLVARLRPDVSLAAATDEIAAIERRRALLSPLQQRIEPLAIRPYADVVLGPTRQSLWLLLAAVGLVLVAACANVANLLLALAGTRLREVATRAALGASRARLVQQSMVESLLLALAAGIAGLMVARLTSGLVIAFGQQRIPRVDEVAFDWSVFAFLVVVCVLMGIFFGLAPALTVGRTDAVAVLKEAGRASSGRAVGRARDALVAAQIALAFMLASGAALVVDEMDRLREAGNGMVVRDAITVHLGQPLAPGAEQQYYEIADRVSRLPQVTAAGFTQVLPLQNWGWNSVSTDFVVMGAPPRNEQPFPIELRYVTPGYFEALGVSIRRGRGILVTDTKNSPPVILINETLARRYFGDRDPVGTVMNRGEIVGVVGDVSQVALDRPPVPEIYFPMAQNWSQLAELGVTLVIRSTAGLDAIVGEVRDVVRDVNPQIAVFNPRTMTQVVDDSLWTLDLYRRLIGGFAALAVFLSAVGLYGVIAHTVSARQREWAVRLALGSAPRDVTRLVIRRGLRLAAIGIGAGFVLTLVAIRLLPPDVQGLADAPAPVLRSVSILMIQIALLASAVPASRAGRIAPAAALREE